MSPERWHLRVSTWVDGCRSGRAKSRPRAQLDQPCRGKRRLSVIAGLVLSALGTGCLIEVSDFAGKSCDTSTDCPEPYVCVRARAGQGSTCELLRLPGQATRKEEVAPDYCHDIKPILDRSCVSYCHGEENFGSSQTTFRLDVYESVGSVAGAKEKAARIKARTQDPDDPLPMPPVGSEVPPLTPEERSLIARWANADAPYCLDAGTPDGG